MNNKRLLLIVLSMALLAVVVEMTINLTLNENSDAEASASLGNSALTPSNTEQDSDARTERNPSVSETFHRPLMSDEAVLESDFADEDNPYQEAAMKAQLMQVADLYQESIQYPPSSQPISSPDQLSQYIPHQSSPVGYPFDVEGLDEPINLSLKTSKFQYFSGESVPAVLDVNGLPESASFDIETVLTTLSGETLMSTTMLQPDEDVNSFKADFTPQVSVSSDWPEELQVRVYAVVDGHRLFISAPLRYTAPSAILQSVEFSSVRDAYLDIPLQFNVTKPGYYFVQANLYSQQTGKPLLHLETEGLMEGDSSRLMLSAHAAALKLSGDEGPYVLKDFNIVRSADENDQYDTAGNTSSNHYIVDGFAFSDYQNTAYQDPIAQERLDFLRKLGQL